MYSSSTQRVLAVFLLPKRVDCSTAVYGTESRLYGTFPSLVGCVFLARRVHSLRTVLSISPAKQVLTAVVAHFLRALVLVCTYMSTIATSTRT